MNAKSEPAESEAVKPPPLPEPHTPFGHYTDAQMNERYLEGYRAALANRLPPLPDPMQQANFTEWIWGAFFYSADQMRSYARAALRGNAGACSMCRGVGSHGEPPIYCTFCKGTGKWPFETEAEARAFDAAEQPAPAWADVVEERLHQWRQRLMNRSGDRLALDDFMSAETIDDLIDFVCAPAPAPAESES